MNTTNKINQGKRFKEDRWEGFSEKETSKQRPEGWEGSPQTFRARAVDQGELLPCMKIQFKIITINKSCKTNQSNGLYFQITEGAVSCIQLDPQLIIQHMFFFL